MAEFEHTGEFNTPAGEAYLSRPVVSNPTQAPQPESTWGDVVGGLLLLGAIAALPSIVFMVVAGLIFFALGGSITP